MHFRGCPESVEWQVVSWVLLVFPISWWSPIGRVPNPPGSNHAYKTIQQCHHVQTRKHRSIDLFQCAFTRTSFLMLWSDLYRYWMVDRRMHSNRANSAGGIEFCIATPGGVVEELKGAEDCTGGARFQVVISCEAGLQWRPTGLRPRLLEDYTGTWDPWCLGWTPSYITLKLNISKHICWNSAELRLDC